MLNIPVRIKFVNDSVKGLYPNGVPSYGSIESSGFDLRAYKFLDSISLKEFDSFSLNPNSRVIVKTGISIELPKCKLLPIRKYSMREKIASGGCVGFDNVCVFDDELGLLHNKSWRDIDGVFCYEHKNGDKISQLFEIQVRSRSGLASEGVFVLNSPGTIDSDYRGEISVILHNTRLIKRDLSKGDRIAQGVICPVYQALFTEVNLLNSTERGDGKFGSTGIK